MLKSGLKRTVFLKAEVAELMQLESRILTSALHSPIPTRLPTCCCTQPISLVVHCFVPQNVAAHPVPHHPTLSEITCTHAGGGQLLFTLATFLLGVASFYSPLLASMWQVRHHGASR